jgi:hypothetical protein
MKILEIIGKSIMIVIDIFLLLIMILLLIWSIVELTKSVRYDHTGGQDIELECEIIGG